jgi:hypothetical protein
MYSSRQRAALADAAVALLLLLLLLLKLLMFLLPLILIMSPLADSGGRGSVQHLTLGGAAHAAPVAEPSPEDTQGR